MLSSAGARRAGEGSKRKETQSSRRHLAEGEHHRVDDGAHDYVSEQALCRSSEGQREGGTPGMTRGGLTPRGPPVARACPLPTNRPVPMVPPRAIIAMTRRDEVSASRGRARGARKRKRGGRTEVPRLESSVDGPLGWVESRGS